MSPRHTRQDDDKARAPYNFVPLNEKVLTVDATSLPDQDRYDVDLKTGYFDVTLTTVSPLFIRGMLNEKEFAEREKPENKNKPDFFRICSDENQPVIPGSSLRGMIRSIVEIITFSRMSRVSESRLFYRDLRDRAHYQSRIVKHLGKIKKGIFPEGDGYQAKVRGGILRKNGSQWLVEEWGVARVDTNDIVHLFGLGDANDLYELNGHPLTSDTRNNPNQTPKWTYQHRNIWLAVDAEDDHFFQKKLNRDDKPIHPDMYLRFCKGHHLSTTPEPNKKQGVLILTGRMPRKHFEFVFVQDPNANTYLIPNDANEQDINRRLLDQFQSDFQLTQWQKDAFPEGNGREKAGYLKEGDPVFFLVQEQHPDQLLFFGRAQMFRLPYQKSPKALIELQQRRLELEKKDWTDAIFGFVSPDKNENYAQGDKRIAYAGRVFFSNAHLKEASHVIYDTVDFVVPPILSTPKPTTFQHYLKPQRRNKKAAAHYDYVEGTENAEVQGRKLYWRAKLNSTTAIHQPHVDPDESTQHTKLRAIKPDVTFKFVVHFENLSEVELGALAWALTLPEVQDGHHMLGMGKPFGMGIVQLNADLILNTRTTRYKTVFDGDTWASGDDPQPADIQEFINHFTAQIFNETGQPFTQIDSIRDLIAMLKLRQRRPELENNSRKLIDPLFDYQIIDSERDINDYYGRPMLPSIADVAAADDKRIQEERAVQRQREKAEAAALRKQSGYQVDDLIQGALDYVDKDVFFSLTNPLPGSWLPIIRAKDLGETRYTQEGQTIRAIILSIELDKDGETTILYCRPATRDERRR